MRMRVLHVITALGVGGAERMLLKLLGARALSGVDQHVVAMLPGGVMAGPMRATGAPVETLDFLGGVPVVGASARLALLARRLSPQIVQGWMYHGNLGATLARAALGRNAPLVWGIRQSLPSLAGENAFARVGIRLNKVLSRLPDRLLFNSRVSLEQHRSFGFEMRRAFFLPNGFDTTEFSPDPGARARWRAVWGADQDSVVFGLLARFHPVKDHSGFLRAARQVVEARPQVRFVMAGTGVDRENRELMRAVADEGMDDKVQLLGERQDVAAILSGLDVYVSSSRVEAFSNSVGEALSCALPCVVTDVGDSPQVVGEAGRVVPPLDPVALANAMVALVDVGPEARAALGRRARQRMVSEFGIEAVAKRYADLYAELAAGQQRPA
jgi:glycosyltransferase involved in cell wall biosynthesis